MTKGTETPRTDAEAIAARPFIGKGADFVSLAFARALEQELTAALARAESKHGSWMDELKRVGELETALVQSQLDLMAERTAKEAANRSKSALLAALRGHQELLVKFCELVPEPMKHFKPNGLQKLAIEALSAINQAAAALAAAGAEGKGGEVL